MTDSTDPMLLVSPDQSRSAVFSPDRSYRYLLTRQVNDEEPSLFMPSICEPRTMLFVMLNPSTADERLDDPTIRRCISRAVDAGTEVLKVANAFAWRATDPRELRKVAYPIGPRNDEILAAVAKTSATIVVAWGASCPLDREIAVLDVLRRNHKSTLWCLGRTKDGHPRHPLYIRASQKLVPF